MIPLRDRERIFRLMIESDAQAIADLDVLIADDEDDASVLYCVGWALAYAKPTKADLAVDLLERAIVLTTSSTIRSGCIYGLAEAGAVDRARAHASRLTQASSEQWEKDMYIKLLESHPILGNN